MRKKGEVLLVKMCRRCDTGGISDWNKSGMCAACSNEIYYEIKERIALSWFSKQNKALF